MTFLADISRVAMFAWQRVMPDDNSLREDLPEPIIACAITVHNTLGPGLLESIYQRCLVVELRAASLQVDLSDMCECCIAVMSSVHHSDSISLLLG